jgi:hypothetical protein
MIRFMAASVSFAEHQLGRQQNTGGSKHYRIVSGPCRDCLLAQWCALNMIAGRIAATSVGQACPLCFQRRQVGIFDQASMTRTLIAYLFVP